MSFLILVTEEVIPASLKLISANTKVILDTEKLISPNTKMISVTTKNMLASIHKLLYWHVLIKYKFKSSLRRLFEQALANALRDYN